MVAAVTIKIAANLEIASKVGGMTYQVLARGGLWRLARLPDISLTETELWDTGSIPCKNTAC
jgi:hypothetical protein